MKKRRKTLKEGRKEGRTIWKVAKGIYQGRRKYQGRKEEISRKEGRKDISRKEGWKKGYIK